MSVRIGEFARVRAVVFGLAALSVLAGASFSAGSFREPGEDASGIEIDVMFSPGGDCESRIIDEIGNAEKSLRIQAHYFTSKPIAQAVVKAKKRGVDAVVILDKSQEKMTYGSWRLMKRDGVPVYFDSKHAIANSKIILIDDHTVITGSYNYTKAADEKNAENIVIIRNANEAFEKFEKNFESHLDHSKKYAG